MPYLFVQGDRSQIVFVDYNNKKVYASAVSISEDPAIFDSIFKEIETQSTNLTCSIEVPQIPPQVLESAKQFENQSLEKLKEARSDNAF